MTFCKELARQEMPNGRTVTAWENWDKFAAVPRYEVTVAREGIAEMVIPCARTTWRKKYREIVAEQA